MGLRAVLGVFGGRVRGGLTSEEGLEHIATTIAATTISKERIIPFFDFDSLPLSSPPPSIQTDTVRGTIECWIHPRRSHQLCSMSRANVIYRSLQFRFNLRRACKTSCRSHHPCIHPRHLSAWLSYWQTKLHLRRPTYIAVWVWRFIVISHVTVRKSMATLHLSKARRYLLQKRLAENAFRQTNALHHSPPRRQMHCNRSRSSLNVVSPNTRGLCFGRATTQVPV